MYNHTVQIRDILILSFSPFLHNPHLNCETAWGILNIVIFVTWNFAVCETSEQ